MLIVLEFPKVKNVDISFLDFGMTFSSVPPAFLAMAATRLVTINHCQDAIFAVEGTEDVT